MKYLKLIALIVLFIWNLTLIADEPEEIPTDTIRLEQIEITANRLVNFTTGCKISAITPSVKDEYNSSNLSELLAQISPISIKSYGIAGQSNVALRGMHSKHIAIVWNGINLQNTMNQGFDMNSVPSFLVDEISIQYGGAGALYGSGAVGGVVHFNNNLNFNDGTTFSYQQGIGSFSNFFEGVKYQYSNNKVVNSTKVFHKYGKNDFEFVNTQEFGKPTRKQENSVSEQYGIMQSNLFKINNKQKISTNIWAQKNYLEIPPTMHNSISTQNQNSKSLRIASIWNRYGEISTWFARAYYNYESLHYRNSLTETNSKMDYFTIVGELENKIALGQNLLFNYGVNNKFEKVETINYGKDRSRNRTAVFSSIKYISTNKLVTLTANCREELFNNTLTPFTFSFNGNISPIKNIRTYGNLSRTYNLPSFNDLYWAVGGNDSLKTENGWSWDIGTEYYFKNHRNNLIIDITYFNINLDNNIIWLPDAGGNWSAGNIEKLWSRGIESSIDYTIRFHSITTGINLNYTLTKSTYEGSEDDPQNGNQLIYIPKHKASANLHIAYKKTYLRIFNNFVSERFISKDNNSAIDPYFLTDISIGTSYNFKVSNIRASLKINNIWNTNYQIMAFYAMPLRYYSANLTYTFKK